MQFFKTWLSTCQLQQHQGLTDQSGHTDETGKPPQSNRDRFQQIGTAADMEMDVPRETPRVAKTAEASTARINRSTRQSHGKQQQAAKQAVRVNEEKRKGRSEKREKEGKKG